MCDMNNETISNLTYDGWLGRAEKQDDGSWYGQVINTRDLITFETEDADCLVDEFVLAVDDYLRQCAIMRVCPSKL